MVSIAQRLRAKAEEADVLKKELEGTQAAFKKAQRKVDVRVKEIVDGIQEKQVRAAEDVRPLREENDRLKKELVAKPSEEEILRAFRETPAYYNELNDRAMEKI